MDFKGLTIKKFHEGLIKKEFSALESTQAYFKEIEKKDGEIGAYLSLNKDLAVRQAEEADLKVAKNEPVGMLSGAPFEIKENILIEPN